MRRKGGVPVVVIGGGVIGSAILREFARRGVSAVMLESEMDVGEGTSKANSAIRHTGFDSKPGTVESRMLRRAAELWPAALDELGVPFLALGALMLARSSEERGRLVTEIAANAEALGVTTELLDRAAVREMAPYVADDVVAALLIPDEGVIDPFWLTRAYAQAAMAGGAELRLGQTVTGLELGDDAVTVRLSDGSTLLAEQVVDAAGLRADEVAGLAGDRSFAITPRKGEFLVSEETFGVDRIVLPIPGTLGKGMLVTPIVFGGLLLGPTAVDGVDKDDRSTDPAEGRRILDACRSMVPGLAAAVPVRQFAGLRSVSSTKDFIVRPSDTCDRLYFAAGIRSTGISTSPAVAETVVADVMRLRGWTASGPHRRLAAPAFELPDAAGEIVCMCRSISRGEIVAACRQPTAPRTLDAIKRRGGAAFGDCQGNLCSLGVARILAAERAIPVASVQKHRRGSWLWQAAAGQRPSDGDGHREPVTLPPTADVVVVGAGSAGRAAAAAATDAGASVVMVDWRDGATVIGLSPDAAGGWHVLVQLAAGGTEVRASQVVVATGAYLEPREHRAIAGGRPAGVMTGDLAWQLVRNGLRPGKVVALLGEGPAADNLAAEMIDAGARVERLRDVPDELRGEVRIEGVRAGQQWLDVDTLVLADRLVPQAFVLRGLGLADGRPDNPAPADAEGRLPLQGLWAAGCCVNPTFDHRACGDQGSAIGRSAGREAVGAAAVAAAWQPPAR